MALLLTQLQQQISSTQNSIDSLNYQLGELNNILTNGTYGYDANNNATVTLGGVTYLVSDINSQIATGNSAIAGYQSTLAQYQSQLPLASTVDTPDAVGKSSTVLRTYQHASRIFVDSNYRLSPKYGFLFYVEFDFNPMITNVSNTSAQELGMIVKSVSLPKFTIETKVHNAYNRKNIVQNRINYDPINITFHDDQADNVRQFWYDYYSFFYRDSDYADATYNIITKYQERPSFQWGYSPRAVGSYNSANAYQNYQYIQAIRIYSLYQGQFDEYELINPIIQSFRHGEHVAGENGSLLEHQMSVQFETVKYQTGYTTTNTAGGFIDLHYDNTPSPNYATTPPARPTTVTDLAYYNLKTNGGSVVPTPNGAALNGAYSYAAGAAALASQTSASTTNAGGFALPSLGSLTTGVSGSTITQQLQASAVSVAGTAAGSVANGVVSGVTQGLGKNGTAILGLATAAVTNPTGTLKTVENMATAFAIGAVSQAVNSYAASVGQSISTSVSTAVSDENASLGQAVFGSGTFTSGVAGSVNNLYGQATGVFTEGSSNFVGPLPSSGIVDSSVSSDIIGGSTLS